MVNSGCRRDEPDCTIGAFVLNNVYKLGISCFAKSPTFFAGGFMLLSYEKLLNSEMYLCELIIVKAQGYIYPKMTASDALCWFDNVSPLTLSCSIYWQWYLHILKEQTTVESRLIEWTSSLPCKYIQDVMACITQKLLN